VENSEFSKRFKEQILHVFKYTVEFLNKHNLRYIACGGTVLGAVRHQDFIPWDDDMDIYMPRADYEQFLSLKQETRKDGFDILSLRDEGYYLPFAKISDMHTTLLEQEEFPFLMGVYVDVFALDNFEFSDQEITKIQRKSLKKFYHYLKSVSHKKTSDFWKDIIRGNFKEAQYKLEVMVSRHFRKPLLKAFFDYQDWYSKFDGNKTVCVTQWAGKIFKREWFEDTISLPFGDTTVIVPRDYDGYLTCLYGDYMTLPPKEMRVSDHSHLYLNFNEGLPLNEVLTRCKEEQKNNYTNSIIENL